MSDKNWSYGVTHRVPATFHSVGAFTRSAEDIYKEMRRPEVSPKGLASAIQMNQFFINRAGKALDPKRREEVQKSIRYLQAELKYRNAIAKKAKDVEQLAKEWKDMIGHIDLSKEPEPAQPMNKYLAKIAGVDKPPKEGKSKPGEDKAVAVSKPAAPKAPVALTAGIGGASLIGTGFWQQHMPGQQDQQQQQTAASPKQGLTNP